MRTITIDKIDGEYKVNVNAQGGSSKWLAWGTGRPDHYTGTVYVKFETCPPDQATLGGSETICYDENGKMYVGTFAEYITAQGQYLEAYHTESSTSFHLGHDQWFWYTRLPERDFEA